MQNDVTIEVRWGECDPFHIVFYPNFFTWFDHCTWKLFAAAGLTPEVTYRDYGFIGMPLVDAPEQIHFTGARRRHDHHPQPCVALGPHQLQGLRTP